MSAFDELLASCGVRADTLSAAEGEALDRRGYVVLAGCVDREGLERLRAAFEAACERPSSGEEGERKETGTRHPADLARADAAFEGVWTHPRVLAAVQHVLGRPFQVLFLAGRDPLPGWGQQGLHTDWTPRAPREPFAVVTSLWLLDDFTPENGATRVLPGTHLIPRALPKSLQQPEARHPDQELVLASAGSVLVLNGHLCHGGMRNGSRSSRRVLQCRWVAQDRARPKGTQQALPGHLGRLARGLLGSRAPA